MKLNNVNISTLIVNKYINTHNYKCNYNALPRSFYSLALMLKRSGFYIVKEKTFPFNQNTFFTPQNCTYRSFLMLHFDDFIQYQNKIRKIKYEKLQQCLLNSQNDNFITAATFFDILSIAISKMNTPLGHCDRLKKIKPAMNYLQLSSDPAVPVKYLVCLCIFRNFFNP